MRLTWLRAPTEKDHGTTMAALKTCFGHQAGTAPYDGAFFERHGGEGDRGELIAEAYSPRTARVQRRDPA